MIIPGIDESVIVDGHPNFRWPTPQQIENDALALKSSEIARDAAQKFLAELALRDEFYYPSDPEHPGLVRDTVSVVDERYRNLFYVSLDSSSTCFPATLSLASGAAATALAHIDNAKATRRDRKHSTKRSVLLDNGKKISAVKYLFHDWSPQYAKELNYLAKSAE